MICKLNPAWKDYLWGGTRLKTEFGKAFDTPIVAETWELSCHPDGDSVIATGAHQGKSLAAFFRQYPAAAGTNCIAHGGFPLLIKLIDSAQNLSVQVHPDDAYAKAVEGQNGKTEMWYVLDAQPDAQLYYGFAKEITKEEFLKHIAENTLLDVLNAVKVKKGDSFFIEAGTVHAIGAGLLVAEVQQSSNVTYRIFDYGRKDAQGNARELHLEKAKEVSVLKPANTAHDFEGHLAKCPFFCVDEVHLHGTKNITVDASSCVSLLVIAGNGQVHCGTQTLDFVKGESILATAQSGLLALEGEATILLTTVGEKG